MNMSQLMQQAQQMQRKMQKAKDELNEKEFTLTKNGMVTITMTGDKNIIRIEIDKDALDEDNKEMLEESIGLCVNELVAQIDEAFDEIEEKITGQQATGLF